MKKIFLLLLIAAAILVNCKPKQKQAEKEKPIVDSLTEKIDPVAKAKQDSLLTEESKQSIAPWKRKPITITPSTPSAPAVTNPPAVCYIEFNGATVSGTNWNTNGDIICASSGLTLDQVKTVMDSAASRFTLFHFNGILTTDKSLYDAAPSTRRAMCIITTTSDWFGAAGGTAFRNSFGTIQPSFVFSQLVNFKLKYIWEDIPHELGHMFSLYDEFSSTTGTYCYCSIMGCGYYLASPKWSIHNGMNDTLVIQTKTN